MGNINLVEEYWYVSYDILNWKSVGLEKEKWHSLVPYNIDDWHNKELANGYDIRIVYKEKITEYQYSRLKKNM